MAAQTPWIVLKFGGTSVGTAAGWSQIAAVAQERLVEGLRPVLVCSALAGVSDQLEALLPAAVEGRHQRVLDQIGALHDALCGDLGITPDRAFLGVVDELHQLALGVSLTGEITPRLTARVLATGELMSTLLGAQWLQEAAVGVSWVDARSLLIATDGPGVGDRVRYLSASCGHDPDPAIAQRLAHLEGDLLITQGFIARTHDGETVLLGRGGSDTSAAYLAARLQAARCEIWTDVPGLYTADPRRVPEARLLRRLDYAEAQEIATMGAKVLHPRCLVPLRANHVPLWIKCTPKPGLAGTVVGPAVRRDGPTVKAISSRRDIVLVSMETVGMWQQVGFLADAFACFKARGVSVDMVSTSETNVTVTLDRSANLLDAATLDGLLADLGEICEARLIPGCAAVSLVGRDIRSILHRLAPVFELFEEHRVHLLSQAASDLNLTVVVDQAQEQRLVQQLHELLFQHGHGGPALGPSWAETLGTTAAPEASLPRWWQARREELLDLAQSQTPLYVYDAPTLDARARALKGLRSVGQVLFAVKANPNPDILRRFYALGLGFECVSPGELQRVRGLFPDLGGRPLLFTPNFAPKEEYVQAFGLGARVTLDNVFPLEQWPEVFAGKQVFLRLDPGTGRGHHAHVRTAGSTSKFGIASEDLDHVAQLCATHGVQVVGLHAHAGSGIRDPDSWTEVARFLGHWAGRFADVKVIDLGGGLGVPEKPGHHPLDLAALDRALAPVRAAHPGLEIWLEPGRFLVAEAGVLLTRVTQTKAKGEARYLGVDAGMHSLIRPMLYGAWHDIRNLSAPQATAQGRVDVVGPICESGDVLGHGRALGAQAGDVLLVDVAGAYGRAMASQYNLRPLTAERVLE